MPFPGAASKLRVDRSRAIVAQTVALLYADFPLEKFIGKLVKSLAHALNASAVSVQVDDGECRIDRSYARGTAPASNVPDLTVPIALGAETLGLIRVSPAKTTKYGENDARAVEAIARYIAIAVRNSESLRGVVRPAKRLRQAILGVVVFALLATAALVFYGLERARHISGDATAQARGRATAVAHTIDLGLTDADQLVRTSAALAWGLAGNSANAERTLHDVLTSAPRATIYGAGLWYEPYMFDSARRLYGPYVHRNWADRRKSVLTYFWQNTQYDYPRHDWYVLGKNSPDLTVFTPPYFDVDRVYVSAVHAFHTASGKFAGVASVGLTLGTLSKVVAAQSAAPGDVLYVTLKNGNVFVYPHQQELLGYARRGGKRVDSILDVTGPQAKEFVRARYGDGRQDVTVPVSYVGWVVHDSARNLTARADAQTLWGILIAALALLWIAAAAAWYSLTRLRANGERAMDFELERSRLQLEVQARAESEARLRAATLHDDLTGVLNRAGLVGYIDDALRGLAEDGERFGVLFIDLDRFSRINDRIGRDAGDRLLREVAARLGAVVAQGEVLGRYGGDEFVVVKREGGDSDAVDTAERIGALLATPFPVNGQDVVLSASIGIAYGTSDYDSGMDLLRDADIALFEMRSGARARYGVFTPETRKRTQAQAQLEADLHRALEREELFAVYQPVADLSTLQTVGFEALVRWRHPDRGILMPADFVPLAERSGSILAIDRAIIRMACRQIERFSRNGSSPYVAVNISALHFAHGTLASDLIDVFESSDLDPNTLRLELTETALVDHPQAAAESITRLRKLGVRVQIDDFGTGYSSLSYLQQLSIDGLKIDRSFVSGINERDEATAIVRAIVELARVLGLEVVAEGIETAGEARTLQQMHVRYGQGFWIAHPLPAEEASRFTSSDGAAQRR